MRAIALSGILAAGVALSACTATTGANGTTTTRPAAGLSLGSSQKTDAERKLEADAKSLRQVTSNIIVRNTVQGALVGAAAGCGIAMLLGGNGSDCARGAVAGGVVGGVAGNQVGRAAAAKNVELVKRDQVLANLQGVSTRLNGVEKNLQAVVRSQNSEIASLNRQLRGGQISQSAYNSRVSAINSNRTNVSRALADSENDIVKSRNEIRAAQQKGQRNLGAVDNAAASTQQRLARNRKLLTIVQ
jgi:uncharacterized protein YukE